MNKSALALICIGMVFGVVYVSQANDWQTVDSGQLADRIVGNPPPPTDCIDDAGNPCDEPPSKCCRYGIYKSCDDIIKDSCTNGPVCTQHDLILSTCGDAGCKNDTARSGSICTTPTYGDSVVKPSCKLSGESEECPNDPLLLKRCTHSDGVNRTITFAGCNNLESDCPAAQQPASTCHRSVVTVPAGQGQ